MATCNRLASGTLGCQPIDEFLVVNSHRFCIEVKTGSEICATTGENCKLGTQDIRHVALYGHSS